MSAALVVMGVAILIHAGVRLLDAQIAQQVRAPCDDLRLKLADAANCARQDLLQADVVGDFDSSSAVRAFHSSEAVCHMPGR